MHASVTPDNSTEAARPTASSGTSAGSAASATARNPALANAARARVARRSGKSVVRAPTMCTAEKRPRKVRSAILRGSLLPSIARTGAPTTIPAAKSDVSSPAVPMETPVPAAIWGRSPERTNSDVPWAKTAAASRKMRGGKGIDSDELSASGDAWGLSTVRLRSGVARVHVRQPVGSGVWPQLGRSELCRGVMAASRLRPDTAVPGMGCQVCCAAEHALPEAPPCAGFASGAKHAVAAVL